MEFSHTQLPNHISIPIMEMMPRKLELFCHWLVLRALNWEYLMST